MSNMSGVLWVDNFNHVTFMAVVMLSISCSTIDCNSTTAQPRRSSSVLYLTKTFVVETLYDCNLLCYVKCSTSLLTFKADAMSFYHIM